MTDEDLEQLEAADLDARAKGRRALADALGEVLRHAPAGSADMVALAGEVERELDVRGYMIRSKDEEEAAASRQSFRQTMFIAGVAFLFVLILVVLATLTGQAST